MVKDRQLDADMIGAHFVAGRALVLHAGRWKRLRAGRLDAGRTSVLTTMVCDTVQATMMVEIETRYVAKTA